MNLGILEGVLWVIMSIAFFSIAVLLTIGTATLAFISKHKFWLILLGIAGWVGYKLVKNSEKGKNILDAEVLKSSMRKFKCITRYLK